MYPNRIMPNNGFNMRRGSRGNDRLFGGGFAVPFLLGGITGGLLARPGGFFGGGPVYGPYPVYPQPYIINNQYPYPTYTENYYYY